MQGDKLQLKKLNLGCVSYEQDDKENVSHET